MPFLADQLAVFFFFFFRLGFSSNTEYAVLQAHFYIVLFHAWQVCLQQSVTVVFTHINGRYLFARAGCLRAEKIGKE